MATSDARDWELYIAQAEIRLLKTRLFTARVSMEEQDRITQAGIARLREKHSKAKANLRLALERASERDAPASIAKAEADREKKENLERALGCGICLDIMHNPDTISTCGHTFCQECLLIWFDKRRTCPTCVGVVSFPPNVNRALESAIESLIEAESAMRMQWPSSTSVEVNEPMDDMDDDAAAIDEDYEVTGDDLGIDDEEPYADAETLLAVATQVVSDYI
ncbi:hypothetical protein C8R46DRAFT_1218218 [Mycena filopes]|nr:hypothetical protein C8R46DRAFT_1228136 [Mycena filopes]KAJ7168830.1 hypothetical protein C8R46DRAFT_1218218 [Mycena filopes]